MADRGGGRRDDGDGRFPALLVAQPSCALRLEAARIGEAAGVDLVWELTTDTIRAIRCTYPRIVATAPRAR